MARMAKTVLGRPIYFTASYFVDGLLVDTGPLVLEKEFLAYLKNKLVEVVVNTHHHEDHIGNNAVLQEKLHVPVFAFSLALPALANPHLLKMAFYRRFSWGVPRPSSANPVGRRLRVGGHDYEIFYTPGHSDKDITIFEPNEGWAFTGDLFVRGRDRVLRRGSDVKKIMDSLGFLQSLEIRTIFPGSGHPVLNPKEELEKKLTSLRKLKEEILKLHKAGAPISEIKARLFRPTPLLARISAGDYSAENLIWSVLKNFG